MTSSLPTRARHVMHLAKVLSAFPPRLNSIFAPVSVCVCVCVKRKRALTSNGLAGRASDFVIVPVLLNQGRERKKAAHQLVGPGGHGWSRFN
jgi:hypothetical protein